MFSWLSEWMKWLVALVFGAWVLAAASGCSWGTEQWYEKANPQTEFSVKPNALTNTVDMYYRSNEGRDLHVGAIKGEKSADGFKFEATDVSTEERSVENRTANVAQITASGEAVANVATANWTGLASAIREAAPIAGPYLQSLGQAKLAKAQRPALVNELAGLVLSGHTSTAALSELDADAALMAEVDRLVAAKLAAIQAESKNTTTDNP